MTRSLRPPMAPSGIWTLWRRSEPMRMGRSDDDTFLAP